MICEATNAGVLDPETDHLDLTTRLIVEHEAFLRGLAARLARQPADVDDLVQETMLRAFKARDRFETGTSIRAWLATILHRLFLTGVRTERRRATHVSSEAVDLGSIARDAGPEFPALDESDGGILRFERVDEDFKHAFERLPSECRELLVLASLDGLSYRAIAARLRIPVGTVMSRVFRARQRIRAALGERRMAQ